MNGYTPYTPEQIRELLTEDVINAAFNNFRIHVRFEKDDIENTLICFPHLTDPTAEESYLSTNIPKEDFLQMPDDIIAESVVELFVSLLKDDPDTYEDEITFYTNLILNK